MKAGFAVVCGCRQDVALDYVERQMEMKARYADDNCTIEVEIAPSLFAPSSYYFESDLLLRKHE